MCLKSYEGRTTHFVLPHTNPKCQRGRMKHKCRQSSAACGNYYSSDSGNIRRQRALST